MSGLFNGVFNGLGQDRRVTRFDQDCAAFAQSVEDGGNGAFGVDGDAHARHGTKGLGKGTARMHTHGVAQMRADGVVDFFRLNIKIGCAILVDDREGQGDWRMRDIGPANVERPRHTIQRADDRRVIAAFVQPIADGTALLSTVLAGILIIEHDQLRIRRCWLIGPHGVNGVAVDSDKFCAFGFEGCTSCVRPAFGVEPGIIANPRARRRMMAQPVRQAGFGHADIGPVLAIYLLTHLQRVAPIGEDRRFFAQYDRCPGGPAKAREPRQPLSIVTNIFGHMFITDGHDKAVETV